MRTPVPLSAETLFLGFPNVLPHATCFSIIHFQPSAASLALLSVDPASVRTKIMWKFAKEEDNRTATPVSPARPSPTAANASVSVPNSPAVTPKETRPLETKPQNYRPEVAHIGKSVVVKGELSGSEDLYLDGEVEGSIELNDHSLIIGPNGRIRADVRARDIIVHGKVDGNLYGGERVELKKSAVLVGDVFTQRIAIEDGAYFKGGIDIQKNEAKNEAKANAAAAPVSPVPAVAE